MDIIMDHYGSLRLIYHGIPFYYGYCCGLIPSEYSTPPKNHGLVGNFHIIGTIEWGPLILARLDC